MTVRILILTLFCVVTLGAATTAGTDPWSTAMANMRTLFTGPVVTALAIVATIIGGLTFAFGEGASKKAVAGLIFGVGMALAAVPFLNWITPTATTVGQVLEAPAVAEAYEAEAIFGEPGIAGLFEAPGGG